MDAIAQHRLAADLSVSCWNLATLKGAAPSAETRRALLQKGLAILSNQRVRGQLPASNAAWIKAFENALTALQ
jgi:hypothetical protein